MPLVTQATVEVSGRRSRLGPRVSAADNGRSGRLEPRDPGRPDASPMGDGRLPCRAAVGFRRAGISRDRWGTQVRPSDLRERVLLPQRLRPQRRVPRRTLPDPGRHRAPPHRTGPPASTLCLAATNRGAHHHGSGHALCGRRLPRTQLGASSALTAAAARGRFRCKAAQHYCSSSEAIVAAGFSRPWIGPMILSR